MARRISHSFVDELKVRASILMKALEADNREVGLAAARRFMRLPELASLDGPGILAQRDRLQRRHALSVVAGEVTYPSWDELLLHFAALEPPPGANLITAFGRRLYPIRGPVSMKQWFVTHADAERVHREKGGFLFPYEKQFFICDAPFVKEVGMDPRDPTWQTIGHDWVRPLDISAWRRLNARAPVPKTEADGLPFFAP